MARNFKKSSDKEAGGGRSRRTSKYQDKRVPGDKYFKEDVRNDKANDPLWYTRNEALAADAGRISFTYPIGLQYDLINPHFYNPGTGVPKNVQINGADSNKLNIPTIMGMQYVPTYGNAKDGFSAINIAAQRVYSKVRYENSGARNYFEPDLMLYLMACDQIYTLYIHIARAYGVVRDQNQLNRAVPAVLLNAMGFDYDEVIKNQANLRAFLNTCAARISSLAVPNTLPIFLRHMELPLSVYKDTDDAKAQLYVYRPQAFGIYREKSSERGGYLEVKFMSYKRHLEDWMDLMSEMIAAVRDSEDCGIISGDIIKAFGAENLIRMPSISDDYTTEIGYHPEMLGQIANTTIMPGAFYPQPEGFESTPLIYQDPDENVLKSDIKFGVPNDDSSPFYRNLYGGKRIMIGLTSEPDVNEVLVNSRLMCIPTRVEHDDEIGDDFMICDHVGSEVVVQGLLYSQYEMDEFYEEAIPPSRRRVLAYGINVENAADPENGIALARLSAFKYHPICSEVTGFGNVKFTMDIDNFALIDETDLARMHDTCLMSMLDVPAAGFTIK